ncbi:MAG: hypothetical protein MI865_01430 [Proteobacteria bacterium]|nr:hypothetical protein [Pseudomonadota bacterium]
MTRFATTLFVCIGLSLAVTTNAEESAVYESVDDITIGRVFLTPEQRRWLDANRGSRARASGFRESGSDDKKELADENAAGYIIDSSGKSRAWSGSDFVKATSRQISEIRFPGDVRIVRHAADPEQPDASDEQ